MLRLFRIANFGGLETYSSSEEALKDLFNLWHENEDDKVFVLFDENGNVHSVIVRGEDPNVATVCRNGGTAQRFQVCYDPNPGRNNIVNSLP